MKKDNPNKPFALWVGYKGGVSIVAPKVTLITSWQVILILMSIFKSTIHVWMLMNLFLLNSLTTCLYIWNIVNFIILQTRCGFFVGVKTKLKTFSKIHQPSLNINAQYQFGMLHKVKIVLQTNHQTYNSITWKKWKNNIFLKIK